MIKKIKEIGSLGLYSSFDWDNQVLNIHGRPENFNFLNIIYGRNYSGKTTLSRMFRYFSDGKLSSYYENPSFFLEMKDGEIVGYEEGVIRNYPIRVFNEDFCLENLSFVSDYSNDAQIASFAVFGVDNNKANEKISELKFVLGNNEDGNETGKYLLQKQAKSNYEEENEKLNRLQKELDDLLQKKATKSIDSIKNKNNLFGDFNYNVGKLKRDISIVGQVNYMPLNENEFQRLISLVSEPSKEIVNKLPLVSQKYARLCEEINKIIGTEIISENKIAEFLKSGISEWARRGKELHECNHERCLFCGGVFSPERWNSIVGHFDEQSEIVARKLKELRENVISYLNEIDSMFFNKRELFYDNYVSSFDALKKDYLEILIKHKNECNLLLDTIKSKEDNMLSVICLEYNTDIAKLLDNNILRYNYLSDLNNNDTIEKQTSRKKAQDSLRLFEVYNFVYQIGYFEKCNQIQLQMDAKNVAFSNKDAVDKEVAQLQDEIKEWENSMVDESKGAEKVNEYLEQLGGCSLKLVAQKDADGKSVYFQVSRNGVEAQNLSEGERKIIAFCYFLAKLNDVEMSGKKAIVWIDDPICSLDSNHVFFVYSLIRNQLSKCEIFEQLFISTHNLEFLKYLKRLKVGEGKGTFWLMVERTKNNAFLRIMPKYMKNHVTEFEYLFEQICHCATNGINDDNYPCFYNFGNNARKFLEIYLYYKYPKQGSCEETLVEFLGSDVAALWTDRINNEMSHLDGGLERGSELVEFPEIKNAAKQILVAVKRADSRQYESLLKSINMADPLCAEVESA